MHITFHFFLTGTFLIFSYHAISFSSTQYIYKQTMSETAINQSNKSKQRMTYLSSAMSGNY